MEKLFLDLFIKNQNWAYLWINCLNSYTVWFYCMQSWVLSIYILKLAAFQLFLPHIKLFYETKMWESDVKEILQFCSTTLILQILAKKSLKHLLKVWSSNKFVVKTICCLLSLVLWKRWANNYPNRGNFLIHLLKFMK